MSTDIQRLRGTARECLWAWDPYGIGADRDDVPDQYDDWIDDLVRTFVSDPTTGAIRAVLVKRLVEEELNADFVEEFGFDAFVAGGTGA